MNKSVIAKTLSMMVATSLFIAGNATADSKTMESQHTASNHGSNFDNSIKTVSGFFDDTGITAKVKAQLIDDSTIKSTDISVTTDKGIVTLRGFVLSQAQAETAVAIAKKVEGVNSVSDQLHVKDSTTSSVTSYAGDSATTTEIKARLLTDDLIPSRNISVETTHGVVQLSGEVENRMQADRAESIAKAITGVKSVKNDLKVKA
ncbi:molecular chaperone OsmY [Enterobacteriaceae bacterium LUAb1]